MKISTLNNLRNHKRMLPIAAAFMMSPVLLFAQTKEQLIEMRKETNLKDLNTLKKGLQKSTMTTQQLKTQAKTLGIPFSGTSLTGQDYELKGFDKKGRPLYYVTYNKGAAEGTQTNKLYGGFGFNLSGDGLTVHEWDGGGVRVSHEEFQGRATQKDTPTKLSDHATHVGGTMIAGGINPALKGMAYKAKLNAYDWTDDTTEMVAAAADGALVSNHSYGYTGGFAWGALGVPAWVWLGADEDTEYKYYGKYTDIDREYDLIAKANPYYLPVKAAGNPRGQGPEPGEGHYVRKYNSETKKYEWTQSTKTRQKNGGEFGFDCINFGATSKNLLIVGAAHKLKDGYKTPADVKMASFSAFGPIDDGRIKPDIAGIGVGLLSPTSTGDTDVTNMSGTSMASPNVTGTLLLLQEHYKNLNKKFMHSATLKALVIGTADEAGENAGPDYGHGWGLLNAYKAVKTISLNGKYSLVEEKELANKGSETISVTALGTEPLKVTIAWTDAVPTDTDLPKEDVLNDRTKTLVNDLDIKVLKNGTEYLPWKLDPANPRNAATTGDNDVDNVEQVVIDSPEAGAEYQIVISHKGDLRDNELTTGANGKVSVAYKPATSQKYSMVVTGINKGVQNDLELLSAKIAVPAVEFSTNTPVEFEIANKGTVTATGAKLVASLVDKDDADKVLATKEIEIGDLAKGESVKKTLEFDLSQSFKNYEVKGSVVYSADEIDFNNMQSVSAYNTLVNLYTEDSTYTFDFEADMEEQGWTSEDTDKDGSTWQKYSNAKFANTGTSFALNFPNKTGTNDWLFSTPLKVKGGKSYRVVTYVRKFQQPEESLEIFYGDAPNSTAMTNSIGAKIIPGLTGGYSQYVYEFQPAKDGVIYVGFKHQSQEKIYAIGMDDTTIEWADTKPKPEFKADKLKVTTFEKVSFTNLTVGPLEKPISYEWSFEPSTVEYQDGTNNTSKDPKVILKGEGTYKVSLKATNSLGATVADKVAYITAQNEAAKAAFTESTTSIYEGETVVFTNTSTGNPAIESQKWVVTPSEGVEFVSDTQDTSKNPVIKFGKEGSYSVALTVRSKNNEDTLTKSNLINVRNLYASVSNLKGEFDKNTNTANLTWERPPLWSQYFEDFEGGDLKLPAELTIYNANDDANTWVSNKYYKYKGAQSIVNYSWRSGRGGAFDVNDWFITPKLRKGAEVLKFMVAHQFKEQYDVYVIEAPASGNAPTLAEAEAGQKVYSWNQDGTGNEVYQAREIDIKQYTDKDFFVGFHHKTTKADNGFALTFDDIEVGYKNASSASSTNQDLATNTEVKKNYKQLLQEGKVLVATEDEEVLETTPTRTTPIEFGVTNAPAIKGYKIVKNGVDLASIEDFNQLSYSDKIDATGTYTYDVYAVYEDTNATTKQSPKQTVSVEVTVLSTDEVSASDRLKVYPNPSDGRFVIEAKSGVSKLDTQVYDMSGKLIFKKEYQGNKADLNLTQHPKGIYLLNVVDNNGQKQTVKLVIK